MFLALAVYSGQYFVALLATPVGCALAWWMLRVRGERWHDVGVRPMRILRLLGVVVVAVPTLVIGTAVLASVLATATGLTPDTEQFNVVRGNTAMLVIGLLLVWTLAAFGEELIFRGFVMHTVHRLAVDTGLRWPWVWALAVSSLLFGLGHAYQGMAGIVLTGAIGLGYGLTYLAARRSLWASIITHGIYDTIGFVAVYLSLDRAPV